MAAGLVLVRGSAFDADFIRPFLSAATITKNDIVNLTSAGELDVAGAGERILGVALEAATSSSTDVQVNYSPFLTIVMDNDNDSATFAAADVGSFFDIIGATGAQLIDTSSKVDGTVTTNSAQMACIAYNPQGIRDDLNSDTSVGLFQIREQQFSQV